MTIALLTIWHEYNFGACLQTYATIRALREMGHEILLVDYRLSDPPRHPGLSDRLQVTITQMSPETKMFENFWSRFPRTRYYRSLTELREDPPKADLYLVGSDQVWNPNITRGKAATFFLPFGDERIARASYASSLGSDVWNGDEKLTALAATQLPQFKAISCREQEGANALGVLFHQKVQWVLDPSLLHTDYHELTGDLTPCDTLAYYELYPLSPLQQLAKDIASQMNLTYTNANERTKLMGKFPWRRTSIATWIRTIAQSQFVVTHSFHGLALSILYQRPFLIVYPKADRRSTRITGLLQALGLSSRFFSSYEEAQASHIWEKEIDYEQVEQRLSALRRSSMEFLHSLQS